MAADQLSSGSTDSLSKQHPDTFHDRLIQRDGTITLAESWPYTVYTEPGHPTELEDLNFDLVKLCKIAEKYRGGTKVTEVQNIAMGGFHKIYELRFDGGDSKLSLIVRPFFPQVVEKWGREHCSRMVLSEVAALTLVRHTSTIPVPRCLSHSECLPQSSMQDGSPWTLLEKCGGVTSEWLRAGTSREAKIRMLHDFADISVQLAGVPLPGSALIRSVLVFDLPSQSVEVGPPYDPNTGGPFSTFQSYISYLVERAQIFAGPEPCKALDGLPALAARLAPPSADTRMWRPTLRHGDLNHHNILSTDGHIDAVIDWELHDIVPAFLALDYPAWLVDDGIADRRFAPRQLEGQWSEMTWAELEEDAKEYRRIFAQYVSALDADYMRVVEGGLMARRLVEWLSSWCGDELFLTPFAAWRAEIEAELDV